MKHFGGEINRAITSGFRSNNRATPGQAFTGYNTGEFVPQPFIHAKEKPNLSRAHPDVAGRDVGIGADVAKEFAHEGLAEAHYFAVAFAFRIEIGSAFAAAHRQSRQRILKD